MGRDGGKAEEGNQGNGERELIKEGKREGDGEMRSARRKGRK